MGRTDRVCKSIDGVNGWKGQALDWIRWVSQALAIPLLGLALWGWWHHELEIGALDRAQAVMESNRFTSADGLIVWKEISHIQAQLDQKADAIGAEPVREDIKEIKTRLGELQNLILAHIAQHEN